MKARDNPFGAPRVLASIRYENPARDAARRDSNDRDSDDRDSDDRDSDDRDSDDRDGAVSLLPRLEALGYRAAIVGPHGSGKTTLLEDLEHVLARRGFRITRVRLDTENPRLPREWRAASAPPPRLDANDIVCLDGAEQLGPIAWMRFRWRTRRAGGLIITSHQHGRLPTLVVCATNAALLHRIMRRLAPDGLAAAPTASELFARHHGNLRNALRELYDVYAEHESHTPRRIVR